jgi:3-deoxy-D-manno-octulosonic-acid transferase
MALLLNGLYLLLLICVSPLVLWRSYKHGRYRRGWSDRVLGQSIAIPSELGVVWLHAVSVGEVQVLRPLVELFERNRPDLKLAISVSTDSGMDLASRLFAKHRLFFAPLDFTWSIRRTLSSLHPDLIVLAELELWPNWLTIAERMGCPVVVVNGRLSQNSFADYSRIPWIVRRCMKTLDWVGAQSETIAARFEKLGVPVDRLSTTGNVKFDGASGDRSNPEIQSRRAQLGLNDTHSVLLAGSTQSPEESLMIDAFLAIADRYPNLKLIVVPRHVERFDEVAKLIEAKLAKLANATCIAWARRSEKPSTINPSSENTSTAGKSSAYNSNWRIFLGDTVGELRWWWGLADIGLVGGSFGDRGGQNMIEPCAYGVATCFGPNTRNFSDIVEVLLDEKACVQLQSPVELQPWIESMLTDSELRKIMTAQARNVCQSHRGATQKSWENIQRFLPK